jgi:hypothetical protein
MNGILFGSGFREQVTQYLESFPKFWKILQWHLEWGALEDPASGSGLCMVESEGVIVRTEEPAASQ